MDRACTQYYYYTMNIFENIFHHLEAGISEVVEAGALEGDQVPAVAGEGDEGLVSEGDTVGDAEVPGDDRESRVVTSH